MGQATVPEYDDPNNSEDEDAKISNLAFQWLTPDAAANVVMVSLLPYDRTEQGVQSKTSPVNILTKSLQFANLETSSEFVVPTYPTLVE